MENHHFWQFFPRHMQHPLQAFAARRGGRFDGQRGNPFGGNPFGGNPFGGNPFDSFFRHRGRARRGDVRMAILALLSEQPRNGYQLMQEIEQRSQGHWRPSPGSVYPALQQLEDEGLVVVEVNAGGKVFDLTEQGRVVAREAQGESMPWEVHGEEDDSVRQFGSLVRQVVMAASQVVKAGSPAQVAEANKLLAEVRRKLYQLLARDPDEQD